MFVEYMTAVMAGALFAGMGRAVLEATEVVKCLCSI